MSCHLPVNFSVFVQQGNGAASAFLVCISGMGDPGESRVGGILGDDFLSGISIHSIATYLAVALLGAAWPDHSVSSRCR